MSFKVVVAEKPSVARDISKVIGANAKKNGFYEGNNYRVTWCIGHLVTLSYPETYDIKYKKWKIEYLPIIPEDMKTEVIREVKEQYRIVSQLMNHNETDSIICATSIKICMKVLNAELLPIG